MQEQTVENQNSPEASMDTISTAVAAFVEKRRPRGRPTEEESLEIAREKVRQELAKPLPWFFKDNAIYERKDYKALQTMYNEMPISEVKAWAEDVGVKDLGESQQTFRCRVMYAIQMRLYNSVGRPIPAFVSKRQAEVEEKAKVEAENPIKGELMSGKKDESLSKLISRMALERKPVPLIEEMAILHKKYQGNPGKAKSYVRAYLKFMVSEGLLTSDLEPTEKARTGR